MLRIKTLLLTIALLATCSAWAEWLGVAEHHGLGITHYIDPATVQKDGNLRQVWELQDLKQRHKNGYLSGRSRLEFDCKERRVKGLFFNVYVDQMGMGEILSSGPLNHSTDIPPSSSAEIIFNIVCAK